MEPRLGGREFPGAQRAVFDRHLHLFGTDLHVVLHTLDLRLRLCFLPPQNVALGVGFSREFSLELSDLGVEPVNGFDILADVPINVDYIPCHNACLYLGGAFGIYKGIVSVVKVYGCRRDADDHDSLAVPTKGEFQQPCELAIAIGDVADGATAFAKGVDAVSQSQQGLVDVGTFYHPLAHVSGGSCPLTASQIDDRECAHKTLFGQRGSPRGLGNMDLQDRMRAGRSLIRVCWRLSPSGVPHEDYVLDFLCGSWSEFS